MDRGTSKNNSRGNIAYIDGQNLHLGTTKQEPSWIADLKKTRFYLDRKYNVTEAYYYVGYKIKENQSLYNKIKEASFILIFREHDQNMASGKKGNVDTDIVFDIMKRLQRQPESFDKIILVTGDGDYYKLVQYLIEEERLEKILFPKMRYASSLYKSISNEYFDNLSKPETIKRIGKLKRGMRKR